MEDPISQSGSIPQKPLIHHFCRHISGSREQTFFLQIYFSPDIIYPPQKLPIYPIRLPSLRFRSRNICAPAASAPAAVAPGPIKCRSWTAATSKPLGTPSCGWHFLLGIWCLMHVASFMSIYIDVCVGGGTQCIYAYTSIYTWCIICNMDPNT